MAKFATAPVEDVVPRRKPRQPSERSVMQAQYQQALRDAVDRQQALVVDLEVGDKPLTIRNRLTRAAEGLGLEHVKIRRRGQRILAYMDPEDELQELPEGESIGVRKP